MMQAQAMEVVQIALTNNGSPVLLLQPPQRPEAAKLMPLPTVLMVLLSPRSVSS